MQQHANFSSAVKHKRASMPVQESMELPEDIECGKVMSSVPNFLYRELNV